MESVLKRIRDARDNDNKRRAGVSISELVVDGCQVKVRFDQRGDSAALSAVKDMLISTHLESILVSAPGGVAA
jgi:hypothetical protein